MKRSIAYLIYVTGLLFFVYYGVSYYEELRITAGREFNLLPPMIFSSIFSIIIGVYLALPGFINMLKTAGKVKVEWFRVLFVGIPTLLISTSGVLFYNLRPLALNLLLQRIYMEYSVMGTAFIGATCGYTLFSSITKNEITDTAPVRKDKIAKILTLFILVVFILYISLSGIMHPVKLAAVQADIVMHDNQNGYTLNKGKDTIYLIQTEIQYKFEFENMPYSWLSQSRGDYKIRIEPSEKLRSLFTEDIFNKSAGHGSSMGGKNTEISLKYTIGSIDPEGSHPNIVPPSPEVLEEIKNSLYNAELVIEFKDKEMRFSLLDYKIP